MVEMEGESGMYWGVLFFKRQKHCFEQAFLRNISSRLLGKREAERSLVLIA